jgi:hypothetical protein
MRSQSKREWGLALVFLAPGMLAQYVSPQYGIPAALVIMVIGFTLVHQSSREATLPYDNLLTIQHDDIVAPPPDYSEEWGHFNKINDALVRLQSASLDQARELTGII